MGSLHRRMTILYFVAFFCVIITTVFGVSFNKPHIWLILTDDQGIGDIGYNFIPRNQAEHKVRNKLTPTLDDLAKDGLKLDSMYCTPLCGPSRGAIMTGRAPYTTGYGPGTAKSRSFSLSNTETLLFEVLKGNNYHTSLIGKFGISFCDKRQSPLWRGLDNWIGPGTLNYFSRKWDPKDWLKSSLLPIKFQRRTNVTKRRWVFHYAPITSDKQSWADQEEDWEYTNPEEVGVPEGKHLTHVIGDETVKLVNSYAENINKIGKPLFFMTAFRAPHVNHDNMEPEPPKMDGDTPKAFRTSNPRMQYLHMIRAVDDQIAKIVNALKANDLWKDTFIIFLSDNGGLNTIKGGADNLGWIGGKGRLWEGGVRVPSFVRGTDSNLAKTRSNARSDALQHCMDIFPTIVELAGLKTTDTHVWKCKECTRHKNNALDGISQWSNWKATDTSDETRNILVHSVSALHKKNFKREFRSLIDDLDPHIYNVSAYKGDNYKHRIVFPKNLRTNILIRNDHVHQIKTDIKKSGGGAVVGRFNIGGTFKLLKLMFVQRGRTLGVPWHLQVLQTEIEVKGVKLPIIRLKSGSISRLVGERALLLDVTRSDSEGINLLGNLDDDHKRALVALVSEYEAAVDRSIFDSRATQGLSLDIAQIDPIIQTDSNGKTQYFHGAWGGRKDAPHDPFICRYASQ